MTPQSASQWLTSDHEIHAPDSPLGGGGPGHFSGARSLASEPDADPLPHPRAPAARHLDPLEVHRAAEQLQAQTPVARRPAPRVRSESTQTINGVRVTTRPDAEGVRGVQGARTRQEATSSGQVTFRMDASGTVTSFNNGIAWSVVIRTEYGDAGPETLSAYGRGTTDEDKRNGDVTLGFHESCHRADYLTHLGNVALPVFAGRNGMPRAGFEEAIARYSEAWAEYFRQSESNSESATDQVGNPTRAGWCSSNPGAC